jgi:hypothetical protein
MNLKIRAETANRRRTLGEIADFGKRKEHLPIVEKKRALISIKPLTF